MLTVKSFVIFDLQKEERKRDGASVTAVLYKLLYNVSEKKGNVEVKGRVRIGAWRYF